MVGRGAACSLRLEEEPLLCWCLDDDWAAAKNWPNRETVLANLIDQAERENRAVAVVTTAPNSNRTRRTADSFLTAKAARDIVLSLKPKPWPADYTATEAILTDVQSLLATLTPDIALAGATLIDRTLVVRASAPSSYETGRWLTSLWQLLRPAILGLQATPPRIWAT